jgi:hypothetical protein
MSERKGHGNRGSLMDLQKPRFAQSPLSRPIDEAERLIMSNNTQLRRPVPEEVVATANGDTAATTEDSMAADSAAAESIPSRTAVRSRMPLTPPPPEDLVAKLRKNREPIAVVGFKLPAKLKDELAAVAQYNHTDMTRIVVEALERFLSRLPHPPDWKS